MKKFVVLLITILISTLTAIASDLRFIQVSDSYFSQYDKDSVARLEKLIEEVNEEKNVEFVVFTGNNIAKPKVEDVEAFLRIANKLKVPYYVILGNKDVNKLKDLSKTQYLKIVAKNNKVHKKIATPNYTFTKKKWLFVVVDGSKDVIPTSMGYYKDDVLHWLDEQLQQNSTKKVVILQHFPIVPPVQKEAYYTYKADEYMNLLEEHTNVKAVVAGHFGVNKEQEVNGILHISTAPAPCYRIIDILDCDTENPIFWSTIKH